MKKILLLIPLFAIFCSVFSQNAHHQIYAKLDIQNNEIQVTDTLSLPRQYLNEDNSLEVSLNKNLILEISNPDFKITKLTDSEGAQDGLASTYRLSFGNSNDDVLKIPFVYKGIIKEEIKSGAAEYARGFSQTSGIISGEGVYLNGATIWIPAIEKVELFSFRLNVNLDKDWNVVSQGTRTKNEVLEGRRIVEYSSPDVMDEIYLVAANWEEYSMQSGQVLVQAFLRTPDQKLANRYLGVTSSYLKLYEELIGLYPFTKFALVENFWETGYGMPSFTLLGEKVIRFPWILHSSYPHELLHNYWGNSVFVDYETGNWCEGITAYMADHLIQEQQGKGDEYRRTTLQKFTDYVNEENDFPISEFRSRNNSAEEAIGYGKTLMFNEMLRNEFGDEYFKEAYSEFYKHYKFTFASFNNIRTSFEKVTGKDLKPMFDQWILRKGAPTIELHNAHIENSGKEYKLDFQITQVQSEEPFEMNVPIAVYLEGNEMAFLDKVKLSERENTFTYTFQERPLKISIDPQFNVMRRLDRSEVPATLSQIFGSKSGVIVLPKQSELIESYRTVAEFWKQTQAAQGKEIEIVMDSELEKIPEGKAVWIMGFKNKFFEQVKISDKYKNFLSDEENEKMSDLMQENSLVYAIPNPVDENQTLGFMGAHNEEAISGLSRKLLHYGKYGYLGFEGDAPDNVLKGIFPTLNSKMDFVFPYDDNPPIKNKLNRRKALAYNKK